MSSTNRNAEKTLISAVINSGDIVPVHDAGIDEEWFRTYTRQWRFIEARWRMNKKPPSLGTFKDRFNDFAVLKVDDVEYAVTKMQRFHAQQSLLSLINDVTTALEDEDDPIETITEAHRALVKLQGDITGTDRETDLVHGWQHTFGEMVRRKKLADKGQTIGIPTGWATLDDVLGGWQPGHSYIMGARLNVGKTWGLIHSAVTAINEGLTVQFHTLEQTRADMGMRVPPFMAQIIGGSKGITQSDLSRGKADLRAVRTFFTNQSASGKVGKLIVDDTPRGKLSLTSLAAKIERNNPDIVIIDYMQLMTARPGDWQALAELSGEVKQFAADVERPILMASQLNRTSGTSSDAGAEAISGSDNIGMDADLIMFIQDYSKRTRRCKVIKNRHGEKDVVWYTEFDPNVGLFREIGKQRADDLKDEDKDYA